MLISNWVVKRAVGTLACAAALGGMMAAATPAQAWWRGGVWIGVPPVVVGAPGYDPYYYPPYYPYPPAYYPPPAYPAPAYPAPAYPAPAPAPAPAPQPQANAGPVSYGSTCYAGFYVCAAPGNTAVGAGCSCPGLGAPSYGTVR